MLETNLQVSLGVFAFSVTNMILLSQGVTNIHFYIKKTRTPVTGLKIAAFLKIEKAGTSVDKSSCHCTYSKHKNSQFFHS